MSYSNEFVKSFLREYIKSINIIINSKKETFFTIIVPITFIFFMKVLDYRNFTLHANSAFWQNVLLSLIFFCFLTSTIVDLNQEKGNLFYLYRYNKKNTLIMDIITKSIVHGITGTIMATIICIPFIIVAKTSLYNIYCLFPAFLFLLFFMLVISVIVSIIFSHRLKYMIYLSAIAFSLVPTSVVEGDKGIGILTWLSQIL